MLDQSDYERETTGIHDGPGLVNRVRKLDAKQSMPTDISIIHLALLRELGDFPTEFLASPLA